MQHNLPHQARAGPRGEARDGDTPAGHALELPASEIPALEVRTIAGVDYRRAAPAPSRGVQTNIASHDHPRDTCQRLLNWTGPSALAAPGLSIAAPSTVLTTTRARPTLPINRNSCIVSSVFSFSVTSTTTHGAVVPIPPLPATNSAHNRSNILSKSTHRIPPRAPPKSKLWTKSQLWINRAASRRVA
jgi:hypothetical protein